jgi:hypothetical protein
MPRAHPPEFLQRAVELARPMTDLVQRCFHRDQLNELWVGRHHLHSDRAVAGLGDRAQLRPEVSLRVDGCEHVRPPKAGDTSARVRTEGRRGSSVGPSAAQGGGVLDSSWQSAAFVLPGVERGRRGEDEGCT